MSLLIKNGTVVNPAKKQNEVADVLVKDGKIAAIGQNLSAEGAEVYDATGLIVAPGLIAHICVNQAKKLKKISTLVHKRLLLVVSHV